MAERDFAIAVRVEGNSPSCRLAKTGFSGDYCCRCFIHLCMHVCMYVCMYACMNACTYACRYACMHVCMQACIHYYKYVHIHLPALSVQSRARVYT